MFSPQRIIVKFSWIKLTKSSGIFFFSLTTITLFMSVSSFNPNLTRGGPQKPILHFFMENHPTFQYILFKEYKTNHTSKFGTIFSKASTIILHFQKFEKLSLKRFILSMGFWGPPLVGLVLKNRLVWLGLKSTSTSHSSFS